MSGARERIAMSDNEIVARFARLGYGVSIREIAFTTEPVEAFREARDEKWWRRGTLPQDEPGLLVIEGAQPRADQRKRDIVVISLGRATAVMGVDIKPGASPLLPGDASRPYALKMEWLAPPAKALAASSSSSLKNALARIPQKWSPVL